MKKVLFKVFVILLMTLSSKAASVVEETNKPGMPFLEYLVKRFILYQSNKELEIRTGRRLHVSERWFLSFQRKRIEREFKSHSRLQDCDVIILKNGEQINAVVLEVGVNEIKYKRCDNRTGPVYTMEKSGISTIRYANGTNDTFPDQSRPGSDTADPERKKTDGFAIASLVTSGSGLILSFTGLIGIILLCMVGIVFGFISLARIRKSKGRLKGKGFALAGIITGSMIIALLIIIIAIFATSY